MGVIHNFARIVRLEKDLGNLCDGVQYMADNEVGSLMTTVYGNPPETPGLEDTVGSLATTVETLDEQINGTEIDPTGLASEVEDIGNVMAAFFVNQTTPPTEFYLKSSTTDSVKVFKITVNDSGTLSATEVVNP